MYELSGPERREIRKALMSAFRNKDDLEVLLDESDCNDDYLGIIQSQKKYKTIVYYLINEAISRGELNQLIQNAYNDSPGNKKLQIIY